jgi:hypothetical protein
MVAMGASLADKAWDRESAVYRVAGVVSVIGGWLFTALIAFCSASLLAVLIYYGELYMVLALTLIAAFLIIRSAKIHSSRMKDKQTLIASIIAKDNIRADEVLNECITNIIETLKTAEIVFNETIEGLRIEDKKRIKQARKKSKEQDSKIDQLAKTYFHYVQKMQDDNGEISQFYIYVLRNLNNIKKSIVQISTMAYNHVDNMHKPMEESQLADLEEISTGLSQLIESTELTLPEVEDLKYEDIISKKDELYLESKVLIDREIKRIKNKKSSRGNSLLQLSIILESQSLQRYVSDIAELYIRKTKK